jgi:ketosteroid isomerase-like protein
MSLPRLQLLLASVLLVGCAPAPESTVASDTRAQTAGQPVNRLAAEAEVRTVLFDFFAAAERFDWDTIDAMLAPEFEFYSDDAVIFGRQAVLDAMKADPMVIKKLDIQNPRVTLSADGSLAWIKYQVALESTVNDKPYNMNSAETVTLRKDGGRWRMTHNHASIKQLP